MKRMSTVVGVLFILGGAGWTLAQLPLDPKPSAASALAQAPGSAALATDWLQLLLRGADATGLPRPAVATDLPVATRVSGMPTTAAGKVDAGRQAQAAALLRLARVQSARQRLQRAGVAEEILQRLDAVERRLQSTAPQTISQDPPLILGAAPALPMQRSAFSAAPLVLPESPVIPPDQAAEAPAAQPADLADSPETPLHPDLSAVAASLGYEYTRILDHVRTTIRTDLYPGSQKGALETQRSGSGNDVDQASLLIALLRAAQVPSRYVSGVIRVPLAQMENLLGLYGPEKVSRALHRALRPHRLISEGGQVRHVELEWTWAVAHVPYTHYRGSAAQAGGERWVALSPAWKQHALEQGAAPGPEQPPYDLEAVIQTALATPTPSNPVLQVELPAARTRRRTLAETSLDLLPADLPHTVVAVGYADAHLPAVLQPTLQVRVLDSAGVELLRQDHPLASVAGRRYTLSFQPASAADHDALNAVGGALTELPPAALQLRPRIALDGRIVEVGQVIGAGATARIELRLQQGAHTRSVVQRITAGGYAAVVLGNGSTLLPQETAAAYVPDEHEYPAARLLANLGRRYLTEWTSADHILADRLGVQVVEPLPALALVLTQMDVERVDGVPLRMRLDGVALDAAARQLDVISADDTSDHERIWLQLSALQGSWLEQQVYLDQWSVPAISGDQLLAHARAAAIPVLDLQGMTGLLTLGTTTHPESVQLAIAQWLQTGHRVELPQAPLQVGAWSGTGWRVVHADGSTGYFLSGQLAGGLTVAPPEEWFLADLAALLANPYARPPQNDPTEGFVVRLDASAQGQQAAVGQPLERPLSVKVEDPSGRPVVGALVRFNYARGSGTLSASAGGGGVPQSGNLEVRTNQRGVAQAYLKVGTTFRELNYLQSTDGPNLVRVGVESVRIEVSSRYGMLDPGADYRAYVRPGAPHRIALSSAPNTVGANGARLMYPGLGYATLLFRVLDEYDNPVANADVQLSVETTEFTFAGMQCPNVFQGGAPAGFFLGDDCPRDQIALSGHQCVQPSLSLLSATEYTEARLVPSDMRGRYMRVTIQAAGGAPPLLVLLQTAGTVVFHGTHTPCSYEEGWNYYYAHSQVHPISGTLRPNGALDYLGNISTLYQPDSSLEAARPGELLPEPRRIYFFQASHAENGGGDPSPVMRWAPGMPQNLGTTALVNQPDIVANNDAETTAVAALAPTVFEYNIRMPQAPGKIDVHGVLRSVEGEPTLRFKFPPVWSVKASIDPIQPSPIPLSARGTVSENINIPIRIEPADYLVDGLRMEIERQGDPLLNFTSPRLHMAQTTITFGRGWTYDRARVHQVKVTLNPDSVYRIESDRRTLESAGDLIARAGVVNAHSGQSDNEVFAALLTTPASLNVMRSALDITVRRACEASGEFAWFINEPARLSLRLYRVDESGQVDATPTATVFANVEYPRGVGRYPATPFSFPYGEFEYELFAEFAGQTDRRRGRVRHEIERQDKLALGHSLVAEVDLFDGQYSLARTDALLPGRGPQLAFQRTYHSSSDRPSAYGRGWSSNLDSRLQISNCDIRIIGGSGSGVRFEPDGSDAQGNARYRARDGYHGTLIRSAVGFDYYAKDGTRHHYPNGGVDTDPESGQQSLMLEEIADPSGNRLRFDRRNGRVERLHMDDGRALYFEYSQGRLARLTGPEGLEWRYTYDDQGNLIRATQTGARDESYAWVHFPPLLVDQPGVPGAAPSLQRIGYRLSSVRDEIADSTQLALTWQQHWVWHRDSQGRELRFPEYRVSTRVGALSSTHHYGYSGNRGIEAEVGTQVLNPRGKPHIYVQNAFGGVIRHTDPEQNLTVTEWNLAVRQPANVTDPEGAVQHFTYDPYGNPLSETWTGRGPTLQASWTYHPPETFDPPYIVNRVATHTDFAADVEVHAYDPRGRRLSSTRGGLTQNWSYTSQGDVRTHTDLAGHTTTWSFDSVGLPALQQHPDGAVRTFGHDGRGRQVLLLDELNRRTRTTYDQRDRVLLTTHPDGSTVQMAYDDAQRVHTRTNELGRTHTTRFDALGRKTQETDAQGQHQFWEYDANGNVEQFRDARQALTTYTYDDADRLVQIQEPEGKLTTRSYFGTGSVRTERIGQGTELRETVYERNHPRDVPTRIIRKGIGEPDRTLTLGYDGEGRVAFQSDALSRSTSYHYDAFGRETERIEPMGRRTESIYEGMGRKLSETVSGAGTGSFTLRWTYDNRGFERTATDRSGATSQHRYDAAGQRIESIDAEGRVSRWDYDVRGRVLRETLPGSGRVGVYTYDAVGNRIREDLPNAHPRHHTYDALNRRTRTHDELGDVETLAYDPLGAITRRTDGAGHATSYTLDDRGRATQESRPAGRNITRTWTVHDQLASETDARNHTITTRWNAFGELVEQSDSLGTQSWAFDDGGRLQQHADREQRITFYTHDALDRRTVTAWPSLALSETRAYDPLDRVIRETDRNGIDTVYTLDPEGRIRQRQRAGRTETFQYDRTGKLLSQTDGLGRRTTFGYDAAGRKDSETRPLERTLRWTYGPGDEVLTETNGAGETTTHRYDRRLRRIESENPLGQITRMDYDGRGLLTTRTSPNSAEHVWTLAYDTAGRLESVTDPERHTTTYGYDTSDNLTSITEPGGGITTQDYDALDRRTRKQTANVPGQPAQVWSWTLDPEGNALVETRPDGSTATHTYDILNRRLTSAYANAPSGSPESRTYTWDGNSNLTRISETTAGQTTAIETQYDPHNRPIQITDAWNRIWTQAFDDADQRLSLTSNGIPGIQWQYDAGSRPVQISVQGAGTYTLAYDLADRNTSITHPNAAETTHSFDAAGRITDIQHSRAGALTRYQYTYDANGNRLTQTETHGNQTIASAFVYDKADRLTAITEPDKHTAYTLDGMGNRVEVKEGTTSANAQRKYTAEFNARNQLTEQKEYADNAVTATTSFHYDPNGNLIRQSSGGVDTEWRYDVVDRLIQTTPPTGPPTQYRYGPSDVRIAKVRNGEEVRYHYDGERITLETNTLGNPQRHYVYSAAGLLNTTLLGPTPHYRSSHLDAMGSPVLITGSDGSVLTRTRFDAWGVEQSLFGVRDHAIAFQGYWSGIELEETGTLLSAARLYIPSLGIFAERDPVEGTSNEPISFNPYLLGRANPQYWLDPDGRCAGAPAIVSPGECEGIEIEQAARVAGVDPNTRAGYLAANKLRIGRMKGQVRGALTTVKDSVQFIADVPGMLVDMVPGVDVGSVERMSDRLSGVVQFVGSPISTINSGLENHGAAINDALTNGDLERAGELIGGPEGGFAAGAAMSYAGAGLAKLSSTESGGRTVTEGNSGPEITMHDLDRDLTMNRGEGQASNSASLPMVSVRDIPTYSSGRFNEWFDSKTPSEIAGYYRDPAARNKIEDGLRGAGGNHEFLMVAEAPHWAQWGVVAKQVQESFAISIAALNEGGLAKGWSHSTGLKGSRSPGSKRVHNQLQTVIKNSRSLDEFKVAMREWAEKWINGGYDSLPPGFHQ